MGIGAHAEGAELMQLGLELVETNNVDFIETMRETARSIVRSAGKVTSDDLRRYAEANQLAPDHQNAWGAIFKGKEWVSCGRVRSSLPSNHARWITVWRVKYEGE